MAKKPFKRVYRAEELTVAEAARDEEIRRSIEAEFPPLEAEGAAGLLSDPLKKAIERSSKSVHQLAKEAHVSSIVLSQFLAGHRDLRLATAEKLAQLLGLRLVAN